MFFLFVVQCELINSILLLYVGFCFCSSVDKMMLEQGAQERTGLEKYDEHQTESNRLQGESISRKNTDKEKHAKRSNSQ